eukprot:403369493
MISQQDNRSTSASSMAQTRSSMSTLTNQMDNDEFDVNQLPTPYYKPLRIGTVGRKTKLEEILGKVGISFEDYIWYTDIKKLSVKQNREKEYILVLATNCIIRFNKEKQQSKSYQYQDVESMRHMDNAKQYSLKLKFYRKDGNLKTPQKEFNITCKDSEAFFTVQHVIQRQMPLNWQMFFENNVDIQANDCYQFHAYLLKTNRFGTSQPRFILLTSFWMINAKASFEKNGGQVKFEKTKWKIPVEAVIKVQIQGNQEKFNVNIFSDFERQNKVLIENGQKKMKKTERKFTFNDITTCRDFIFHIKRIYHLHNCCGIDNKTPPLLVEIK